MKNIFLRTLETTVKKISIILAIVVGVGIGLIIDRTTDYRAGIAYEQCLNSLLVMQHLMVFFGINGVLLMCFTAGSSSGLIASETHEGTFKLLAAKPNSRTTILTGKILGNVLGLAMLMILSLLSYFSTVVIEAKIDGNLIREMIAYLPSYILYGLMVIIVFSAVSTLLSCICKKKITALLPVLVIMIAAMGFFPIMRVVQGLAMTSKTVSTNLIDLNYHFALMFKQCTSFVGKIKGSTIMGYLTNLFSMQVIDPDIVRVTNNQTYWMENNSLNATLITIIYLVISAACYYGSYVIIRKKDI